MNRRKTTTAEVANQDHDRGPLKDSDGPHPVPPSWRPVLKQIVDAFLGGDYALSTVIECVVPLSKAKAKLVQTKYPFTGWSPDLLARAKAIVSIDSGRSA